MRWKRESTRSSAFLRLSFLTTVASMTSEGLSTGLSTLSATDLITSSAKVEPISDLAFSLVLSSSLESESTCLTRSSTMGLRRSDISLVTPNLLLLVWTPKCWSRSLVK